MNTRMFCLLFAATLAAQAVYAENSKESESHWGLAPLPHYVRLGVSWDTAALYDGTTLEIQSPALAYQGEATHELSLLGTLSSMKHKNSVVSSEKGKFEETYSSATSVGVNWRVSSGQFPFATYLQVGGILLSPDSELAKYDHPDWGGRFAFGVELPIDTQRSVVYLQETVILGLERANKLTHEPDLFNGQTLSLGVRFNI